ncbi:MAG: zinc-ribbon domain-containing protein [Geobacter sp.]|nr:zinc-ribbon domain-containing protein [Geobacter sp.]
MIVGCPKCKTRYRVDDDKVGEEGIRLRCSKCTVVFRVMRKVPPPAAPLEAPAVASAPVVAPAGKRITVLLANESQAFCDAVTKVLVKEPFVVTAYTDGVSAYAAIKETKPNVILLDVALPGMYGFEIADAIKRDPATAAVKVILIASIYDKTRYKRSPGSLYGADDYIEKHHIPDQLATKIYSLVAGQAPVTPVEEAKPSAEPGVQVTPQVPSPQEMAEQEVVRQELKHDEQQETEARPAPSPSPAPPAAQAEAPLSEAHVKAKRLARIIVSDIVLYNQAQVEEGIRNGTFYQLLESDIQEGRNHYVQRVSEEIRKETSYLEAAFEDLIAKKKREFNL